MKRSIVNKLLPEDLADKKIKIVSLILIISVGVILISISGVTDIFGNQLIMSVGVSMIVGAITGGFTALKKGWPLGHWIGLLGGLIISPFIALVLKDAISAYYASFLGPAAGLLIGFWIETEEKRKIYKNFEKIASKDS